MGLTGSPRMHRMSLSHANVNIESAYKWVCQQPSTASYVAPSSEKYFLSFRDPTHVKLSLSLMHEVQVGFIKIRRSSGEKNKVHIDAWVRASQRESCCLIKYILSFCVCVCKFIWLCMCVCTHVHVCIWRLELDIHCLTWTCSISLLIEILPCV